MARLAGPAALACSMPPIPHCCRITSRQALAVLHAPNRQLPHPDPSAPVPSFSYNAYAANNPLNKGIKSIRGMFGGK